MRLLVARHRVDKIDGIVDAYETLADQAAGRVRATVTTAIPLSEADREALGRDLSKGLGKDVRLQARVDPAILGGLVLEVGDRLTDASVAARLDQVRRQVLVQ
jgi:F-type H+-transporting ATPase subunit delta